MHRVPSALKHAFSNGLDSASAVVAEIGVLGLSLSAIRAYVSDLVPDTFSIVNLKLCFSYIENNLIDYNNS